MCFLLHGHQISADKERIEAELLLTITEMCLITQKKYPLIFSEKYIDYPAISYLISKRLNEMQ